MLDTAGIEEESLDLSLLDADERRRTGAFVHGRDRVRYASAHTALRRILSPYAGLPPRDLVFGRDVCPCCGGPHGRPVLTEPSHAPHFSLSHGGDLVLIGVADAAVGVDIEPVAAPDTVAELSAVLHPAEQAELSTTPRERRGTAFTRLWTRKEAYLKGLGTGLGRDLAADYLGTSGLAEPPSGWTVSDVPAGPGYAAACAVLGSAYDTRVRRLSAPA
ncbi:4'-phosphopantetheinyl transferase superfamily protein [Streptomyces sp. NPDC006923]|uniref:4'-phosphopantetheinyl transferase family protein n=1 Tax=Streptomyces sp. NPDC006923 TaxID=3155355 RepID=UPI0033CD7B3C